ncbi:MAG TPA: aspartate ammonia-lyase [Aggregatilineales bacterium]|nr:aspartate ammonia-lyase [Aggregatilineales bacterium]
MTNYRVERDSLGELRVPADALYAAQTQRAVENYPISGLKQYRAFIWSMATVKRAAAEVNHELGLFADVEAGGRTITGDEIVRAMVEAATEIMDGKLDDQFVVDPFQAGAGTSHNMNANEVIANRANQLLGFKLDDPQKPVHPNDHVNMAQSTNDTIPTAIRLGCLWRLDELLETLDDLTDAFYERARAFDDVVKSGRTHLQDAVPIRLGQEFGAYARAIERDTDKIADAADGLRRLGIGGTAIGTGLNAHPEYASRMVEKLQELTGFELDRSDNLFESMQSQQDLVHFSAALRTLAQDLTRIVNDLRLLASGPTTGLNEISLPAVQPGSSIMPGKVNPSILELVNQTMFHVMGSDLTIMLCGQAGQLELNVMMPIMAYNLFQMMDVTINSLRVFREKAVEGLQANKEQAEGWLAKNAVLVTALNPVIGYAKGAEVAKEALQSGRTIREVVLEKGYLEADQLDELLDARKMTEGGILS